MKIKLIILTIICVLSLSSCSIFKGKHRVKETTTTIEQREIREVIDTQIVVPEISIKDTFHFNNDTSISLVKDNIKVKIDYTKKDNKIVLDVTKKEEAIPIKMERTIKETIKTDTTKKEVTKEKKSNNTIYFIIISVVIIMIVLIILKIKNKL